MKTKINKPNKKTVTNIAAKYIKLTFSLLAVIVLLAMAIKGVTQYISVMQGDMKAYSAAFIVIALTYIVFTGITTIKK